MPPSTEREDYEKTLTELTANNIHSGPVIPILPKLSLGKTAEKLVSALAGVVPALGKTITDAVNKLTGLGGNRRKQQKGLDAIEATLAASVKWKIPDTNFLREGDALPANRK